MSGPWVPAARSTGPGAHRRPRFPEGLLTGLLPTEIAVVDALDGAFDGNRLLGRSAPPDTALGAELDVLGDAPPLRRQEFARARICAHAAIAALGWPPVPVLMGRWREPRWPTGLVGSITHCPGFRAAAVARAVDVLALGLDAEPARPLPAEVTGLVWTAADRAGSDSLDRFRPWDRVAFSARESVFKAWFAVTGVGLDFADADLRLQPDDQQGGSFTASISAAVAGAQELRQAHGSTMLTGRFRWARDLVLTAVVLRHRTDHDGVRHHPRSSPINGVCHTDELVTEQG